MQTKTSKMHQNKNQNKNQHIPVLLSEVMSLLDPKKGESYLDLTVGYGGHAESVLDATGTPDRAVLVDRDESAARLAMERLGQKPIFLRQDFFSASQKLVAEKKGFDLILADLGVSSPHLNEDKRGFSFDSLEPLDMRMDPRQSLTAEDIVNTYGQKELEDILRSYGEEPKARAIAVRIVENRPVMSAKQLSDIVGLVWKGNSRKNPATRTFQALRIVVNDELNQLKESLPMWLELLNPGGRLAVISFHSLEDRIVKQFLAEHSGTLDAEMKLLTKKPVIAGPHEIVFNPRSRSAKLRAAVKIKK